MFRALYLDPTGQLKTDLQPIAVAFVLSNEQGLLWVDFDHSQAQESEPILTKMFKFHPLAVDDALSESHIPKLDDWGEYLYIVLHAVAIDAQDHRRVDTKELDIFIGKNYLVTHHDEPIEAVERVWSGLQRDQRQLKSGPDHVLYRLADEIAGSFMPVVEQFDEEIDEIEDTIFDQPRSSTLEHIFIIKRSVLYLRRIIAPQREVLNKLARDDYKVIDEHERVYFRDVYDQLVRMYDITEGVRDLGSGTLDTYLSVTSNRMNDVMKTLTIITTVFMPISFLAGFFGMNFFQPAYPLEAWTGLPAFIIMMGIFIATPIGMLMWMRKRGWTRQGEARSNEDARAKSQRT